MTRKKGKTKNIVIRRRRLLAPKDLGDPREAPRLCGAITRDWIASILGRKQPFTIPAPITTNSSDIHRFAIRMQHPSSTLRSSSCPSNREGFQGQSRGLRTVLFVLAHSGPQPRWDANFSSSSSIDGCPISAAPIAAEVGILISRSCHSDKSRRDEGEFCLSRLHRYSGNPPQGINHR